MRKLLFLLFAITFFTACNSNKDDRRSGKDRNRERDDYRSREDDRNDDRRNTDYTDDRDNRDRNNNNREEDRNNRDDSYYNDGGWSSKDVRDFVDNCAPEAEKNGLTRFEALDYCECMQKKIERLYPDINDAARIDMKSERVKQMVRDCAPRR
jgi:hypothetical protein